MFSYSRGCLLGLDRQAVEFGVASASTSTERCLIVTAGMSFRFSRHKRRMDHPVRAPLPHAAINCLQHPTDVLALPAELGTKRGRAPGGAIPALPRRRSSKSFPPRLWVPDG